MKKFLHMTTITSNIPSGSQTTRASYIVLEMAYFLQSPRNARPYTRQRAETETLLVTIQTPLSPLQNEVKIFPGGSSMNASK